MAVVEAKVLTASKRAGNLELDVKETLKEDRREMGRLARVALKSPTASLWPVRSGDSKRGFRVRALAKGLIITNTYSYAYIVEAKYRRPRRPAATTVALAIDKKQSLAQGFLTGFVQGFSRGLGGSGGRTGGFGGSRSSFGRRY